MLGRLVHQINTCPLWFFLRRAKTILDVGCGATSPTAYFVRSGQVLDGVDIMPVPSPHLPYRQIFQSDIRDFQSSQTYDVVTALDFIEHVSKDDGQKILTKLENLGRRVVIVTPNGFIPQAGQPDNPFQEHHSGWSTEDFLDRGYKVYGMFGPKNLRETTAVLRFRPKFFWGAVVWLLTPIFFFLPRSSFSLLAVYDRL